MFLLRYGASLEREWFVGRKADFVYFVLISATLLHIIGYVFQWMVLSMGLILAIIYYWSRQNPDVIMSFLFGIKFPAVYLPWALVAMQLLMGGSLPVQYIA